MRWVGLLCGGWLALQIACAGDTRLQQTISFQEPAQTVAQILQKLTKQTGVVLFPAPPLDKEILIVDAPNIPLRKLMDAVADALDAEWFEQPNGSYRLSRPAKRAMERRQKDDAALKASLRQAIEREAKRSEEFHWARENLREKLRDARERLSQLLANPQERDSAERSQLTAYSRQLNPVERLLWRVLQGVDLQKLLNIPVRERRVFSSQSGRFLEPLGFEVAPLLRRFAQEQSLLGVLWHDPQAGVDALERQHREQHGYESPLTFHWGSLPDAKPVDPAALRLYLEILRSAPDAFSIVVYVEDPVARRAYRAWRYFSPGREALFPLSEGDWRQRPVAWSEESRLLANIVTNFHESYYSSTALSKVLGNEETNPVRYRLDEARLRLLDPAMTEPHSMITADLLCSYARARGKAVVAVPNENALLQIAAQSMQQAIQSGRDRLEQHTMVLQMHEWTEQGDVLVAKPMLASYRWGDRFERAGVSRLTMRVLQRGYLTLDDQREWLQVESPYGSHGEFWASWRGATAFRYLSSHALLRFLNRLSERERTSLLSGATVRLYEMSPALRNALTHLVYYADLPVSLLGKEPDAIEIPQAVFPMGLPADSIFRVRTLDMACYIPQRDDAMQESPTPIEPSQIGAEAERSAQTFDEVVGLFGVERFYDMEVVLPDGQTTIRLGSVSEFRPLIEKPMRWRELPESVREQLTRLAREQSF
ncbi:MAG: hypothetical protein N2651_05565 [Fimbriimonadales bacterium]|nr:hypothetical protein [Fimbriimonadales bacterium]